MNKNYIMLLSTMIASTSIAMDDAEIASDIQIKVMVQGYTTPQIYQAVNNEVEKLRNTEQLTPENVVKAIKDQIAFCRLSQHDNIHELKYQAAFRPIKRVMLETKNMCGLSVHEVSELAVLEKRDENSIAVSLWKQAPNVWNSYSKQLVKIFNEPIVYMDWTRDYSTLLIFTSLHNLILKKPYAFAFKRPTMEECLPDQNDIQEALFTHSHREYPGGRYISITPDTRNGTNVFMEAVPNSIDQEMIVIEKRPSLEEIAEWLCKNHQSVQSKQ